MTDGKDAHALALSRSRADVRERGEREERW